MKKIEIAKAIGLADENFVAEAAPAATKTKSVFWRKFAIAAACVSIIVTSVCLGLLPNQNEGDFNVADIKNLPDELKPYADSEYIDLMCAIYKYDKARIKNPNKNEVEIESYLGGSFDYFVPKYQSSISVDLDSERVSASDMYFTPDSLDGYKEASSMTQGNDYLYTETTDNQVKGVTEGDLFKRTNSHIFYLDKNTLTILVYSIAGENSKLVSSYTIANKEYNYTLQNISANEMFLSQDGKTLTVLCSGRVYNELISEGSVYHRATAILVSLDVSNPAKIKESSRFSITGNYITARVVDGKIYLFSKFNSTLTDFSDVDSLVPRIDCGKGFAPIPADDIIFPDEITSKYYTVVTKLDESDLLFEGAIACLSYSDAVYVSKDKIFVTRSYTDYRVSEKDGKNVIDNTNMTEITAISYKGEGFRKLGSVCVEGSVKNQYSLDEFNGILRVVTTTGGTRYISEKYLLTDEGLYYGNSDGTPATSSRIATNASLYCIDLSNFEIVSEVRDFAPAGETVESVRFDGTNAYVCTAVVVTFTDPVYFFDLSDMNNITYTDTGDIEGYSSSLVNFGEGLLLGIGYGKDRSTLKIEVYAEDGNKVVSLASYEVEGVSFSTDYKSYFIDRERGLVGLMFDEWIVGRGSRYVLLGFDGYQLFEVVNQKFDVSFPPDKARATIADDYFYMMVSYEFKAIKLFD